MNQPTSLFPDSAVAKRARQRFHPGAIAFTILVFAATAATGYHILTATPGGWGKAEEIARQLREPSGIVYHPHSRTLFVVGDEGTVGEISPGGQVIRTKSFGRLDFEAITVDPANGNLYALVEGQNVIHELDRGKLETLRRFTIDGRYDGQTLIPAGGENLESLAFVPDSSHPEGGRFFIANRGAASKKNLAEHNRSFLAELAVPLKSSTGEKAEARIVGAWPCRIDGLTALSWTGRPGILAAVSDDANLYIEMTLTGEVQRQVKLPGKNQEGIAFDPQGHAYIAQDSGGILKVEAK